MVAASPVPGSLPDRSASARARLAAVGAQARPFALAAARTLALAEPWTSVLASGLPRGGVVTVAGAPGAGATSLGLACAAAATAAGEWAACVEPDATLGGLAAAEAGVVLERFALVRGVPPDRIAAVTAALLDGITCVVVRAPCGWNRSDARRLRARARERSAVLVVHGEWPEAATVRLHAEGSTWAGLTNGEGHLTHRTVRVRSEGRGAADRPRRDDVALAG